MGVMDALSTDRTHREVAETLQLFLNAEIAQSLQERFGLEKATAQLNAMGYATGLRLATRLMVNRLPLPAERTVMKYVAKDLWTLLFRKSASRLQTDRMGIYIIQDHSFRWLEQFSCAEEPQAELQRVQELALLHLALPCGILRGALTVFGLRSSVSAEVSPATLPACAFTILLLQDVEVPPEAPQPLPLAEAAASIPEPRESPQNAEAPQPGPETTSWAEALSNEQWDGAGSDKSPVQETPTALPRATAHGQEEEEQPEASPSAASGTEQSPAPVPEPEASEPPVSTAPVQQELGASPSTAPVEELEALLSTAPVQQELGASPVPEASPSTAPVPEALPSTTPAEAPAAAPAPPSAAEPEAATSAVPVPPPQTEDLLGLDSPKAPQVTEPAGETPAGQPPGQEDLLL